MQKVIALDGVAVTYTLRKNRRTRSVRLSVKPGGKVFVTMPTMLREEIVERFMRNKIEWILKKIDQFRKIKPAQSVAERRVEYEKYKERARELVKERIAYFNAYYKYSYNRVSIKNQRTRWGSCSDKGNLNFNHKIVFLRPELQDYIVVHELCHLREFNHSRSFWNLVAERIPDYARLRKELKEKGFSLC
ncbi:MAG: SprT family zinc-dependent metalloprotease [Candidatus Paceibacterota bacterium]